MNKGVCVFLEKKKKKSCPWLLIDRVKWLCACVMCWPHRDGVSVCHLEFIVVTNLTPTATMTIPYFKGTSEIIARILQAYNIRVAHKPITTLRKLLTNIKDRDQPKDRQ